MVNDGSTDQTEEIVKSFSDERIKYYYQDNMGLARTRNRQLELSNGEFVAFLDQDDLWMPTKLEKQIQLFEDNPKVGFLYSNVYVMQNKKRRLVYSMRATMPQGSVFRTFLTRYPVNLQTVMIKKTLLDDMDHWFDKKLELCEEYDFFLRFLHNAQAGYYKEPLAVYRLHPNMSSAKKFHKFPDEKAYILAKLSSLISEFDKKYQEEIKCFRNEIMVGQAVEQMLQGKKQQARESMQPCRFANLKCFVLYLMTYIPLFLYVLLHEMRGGIILRQRLRCLRKKIL